VLGIDILIDNDLKPWLLEINTRPSFRTETPLDKRIKKGVVKEALLLVDINPKHKQNYLAHEKIRFHERVFKGRAKKNKDKILAEKKLFLK